MALGFDCAHARATSNAVPANGANGMSDIEHVAKRLANSFSQARSTLEGQWGRGDNVSTEDLRVTLQRYRAFFDRLLNV